ncbi:hypothetical protein J6590_073431 [Homalodisca vitripennis]|nr:hypothetical protein J6590_073431 [Homalodisca vitripennis]
MDVIDHLPIVDVSTRRWTDHLGNVNTNWHCHLRMRTTHCATIDDDTRFCKLLHTY